MQNARTQYTVTFTAFELPPAAATAVEFTNYDLMLFAAVMNPGAGLPSISEWRYYAGGALVVGRGVNPTRSPQPVFREGPWLAGAAARVRDDGWLPEGDFLQQVVRINRLNTVFCRAARPDVNRRDFIIAADRLLRRGRAFVVLLPPGPAPNDWALLHAEHAKMGAPAPRMVMRAPANV